MKVQPSGETLGATVTGIDLSQPLEPAARNGIISLLGQYGVLRFADQRMDAASLRGFSAGFGSLQSTPTGQHIEPGYPEVMVLSNIVENGRPIGVSDGGQAWHTDMSYNRVVGFMNVLYAIKVPRRNGRPIGDTLFANMHAAYEALPDELRRRLSGMTVTHDFAKFYDMMRDRPGSTRAPLTDEQRQRFPPSVHPLFLTHPITGRKVLYANPGYAIRINEMSQDESSRMLDYLFSFQLEPQFRYTHHWTEHDVLVWDHIGTIHMANPDYGPDEHRLMKRCQVMADRIFDPSFLAAAKSA
jgi:taurine dioxygenase